MKRSKPAGGDMPRESLNKKRFTEKPSAELLKTNVDIARHNLQVSLKRMREECFRVAKEIALEGDEEEVRQMDEFVRKQYLDEPRKMAEWKALTKHYQFNDDTIE